MRVGETDAHGRFLTETEQWRKPLRAAILGRLIGGVFSTGGLRLNFARTLGREFAISPLGGNTEACGVNRLASGFTVCFAAKKRESGDMGLPPAFASRLSEDNLPFDPDSTSNVCRFLA